MVVEESIMEKNPKSWWDQKVTLAAETLKWSVTSRRKTPSYINSTRPPPNPRTCNLSCCVAKGAQGCIKLIIKWPRREKDYLGLSRYILRNHKGPFHKYEETERNVKWGLKFPNSFEDRKRRPGASRDSIW